MLPKLRERFVELVEVLLVYLEVVCEHVELVVNCYEELPMISLKGHRRVGKPNRRVL